MQWQQIGFLALERQAELLREADRERFARSARREQASRRGQSPVGRVTPRAGRTTLMPPAQAVQPCVEG